MTDELHAFFDKDVFIKLACCDLWEDTLIALGVTHPYRLASATARGCKTALRRMKVPEKLAKEALSRLERMARDVAIVPEQWVAAASTSDFFNEMISVSGIDQGEAILAIVAIHSEYESRLISGDKRFLEAMTKAFPEELVRILPIFITFEQCLLAVCKLRGFLEIRERLFYAASCDGSLRLALGAGGTATSEVFMEAMISFSTPRNQIS